MSDEILKKLFKIFAGQQKILENLLHPLIKEGQYAPPNLPPPPLPQGSPPGDYYPQQHYKKHPQQHPQPQQQRQSTPEIEKFKNQIIGVQKEIKKFLTTLVPLSYASVRDKRYYSREELKDWFTELEKHKTQLVTMKLWEKQVPEYNNYIKKIEDDLKTAEFMLTGMNNPYVSSGNIDRLIDKYGLPSNK